jgi:hypothetical protein
VKPGTLFLLSKKDDQRPARENGGNASFFVKMVGKLQMKLLGGKQFFLGKMVWFGSKVTCFPYLTDWWLNLIIIIVSKR